MRSVLRTTAGFCERNNCNALPKSQLDQSGPAPACDSCSLLVMRSRVCLSLGASSSSASVSGASSTMTSSVSSSSSCSGMGASVCVGSDVSVRRGSLGKCPCRAWPCLLIGALCHLHIPGSKL